MKVRDVMTRSVTTIGEEASIIEAMRLLLGERISGLPVVDRTGAVVGVLSEGDLLRRVELGTEREHGHWIEFLLGPNRLAHEYIASRGRKVGDIMTRAPLTIESGAPLAQAVRLFEKHAIKRLPVVDDGELEGLVTRADLIRAFVTVWSATGGNGDADIRRRLDAELGRQRWAPRAALRSKVDNGVVTLSGVLTSASAHDALRVLVENIPGVTRLVDELTVIEPASGMVIESPAGRRQGATP